MLALIVERGKFHADHPRLLVNLERGHDRIGGRRLRYVAARWPVMRQPAAGTDPDAAVRISPKGFSIGIVPDQPVFGAHVSPRAVIQDRNAIRAASPEAPARVESMKVGDLNRRSIYRDDRGRAD